MLLHFANIPCIHPYPMVSRLHGLLPLFAAFLYQRILPFSFQVGSLPSSTQLPLIPHVPSSQCFFLHFHALSLLWLPLLQCSRFHALMRYSNSLSIPINHPCRPLHCLLSPPPFRRTDFVNRYITIPRCRLPSLGVLQRFRPSTTRVLTIL